MLFNVDSKKTSLSGNELKKYRHKKRILRLLYKHGNLSAPQICKHINVSLPTAFTLLNDLISSDYILSKGVGKSKGGRRPLIYGLKKDSVFVVACDMGRYFTRMTVFNTHNEQITSLKTIETSIDDPELAEKLYRGAKNLLEEYDIPYDKVFGVGIDMPGLIDSNKGINYTIKDTSLQKVKERIQKKFDKLVFVDNDARMQAFGEYIFGKAKDKHEAIVINWNWGIGLGIIINGKIYKGTSGFAGELSHLKMVDNGRLCICGKTGCLETIASSHALIHYANQGIESNIVTQLRSIVNNGAKELTVEDIISAANLGDEFCISILSKIGMALGKGLSYIIQLLNPEIIVLSGRLAKANQFILIPIQQSLNKYCLQKISSNSEIVISELEEKSGLLGLAATLYQKIFSDMIT
ncbi:MAG: ROK family transcriptional regulator [Draconibacterium sp.]|nr:ROK family transcriptional regulator [Draconibacterium sp.]